MRKKTNEEFLQELHRINANIIPEEPYINAITKIRCHCAKCSYSWCATPNALLSGSGCANCAGNIKKCNDDFLKELSQMNPDIEPLEEYKGRTKPIVCRCTICDHQWPAKPANLLLGKGCPCCARKKRSEARKKTNEEFVHELSLLNPNIIPLEPYEGISKEIRCQCKKCGHIWPAWPNNLLTKGTSCPCCNHASTSVVEQIIAKSFSIALGESSVLSRDKKAIRKELDIYIPQIQLAIEFGAWFWHKDKLQKDNEKQRLCAEKGIHLITILEKCPHEINAQLIGDYRIYQENLSAERDYRLTKGIVNSIFDEYGISFSVVKNEWSKIVKESIESAQKRNQEDFIRLLSRVNPSVILISEYTRSDGKVRCKCKVCGHEWPVYASSLLCGHGCPKCVRASNSEKRRLTNEEFISRLASISPSIEPLEPYINSTTPISCRCKICGNVWPAKPANLLFGKGCRKCARSHTASLQSKPIRCVETGVCYGSIAEVTRMGIYNVIKCLKGRQKTAGGYHWEYAEDNTINE